MMIKTIWSKYCPVGGACTGGTLTPTEIPASDKTTRRIGTVRFLDLLGFVGTLRLLKKFTEFQRCPEI